MQVLVSIALQILVNALSVSESDLDLWRVTAGGVYVLLGFGCSTEGALRWCRVR
jgi:hypothetical protein